MSTPSLPTYSHAETPLYSRHPRGDEQTLGLTRQRPADTPMCDWTKKIGNVTLTLKGVPAVAELPVFGRNTGIDGLVELASTDGVANVQIKVKGHVKCKTIAEIGRSNIQVLDTTVPLWQHGDSPCPSTFPFTIPFPTTYTWGNEKGPLPPSFEYTFYDVQGGTPGLRATIKYSLQVEVEQSHPTLKDRFSSSFSTALTYLPRSRPSKPPSSTPKTVFEAVMEHRVGGKNREVDPIVWKLILPQPGTYPLKQPIPFRVVVTSRSSSLIAPFAPGKKDKASIRVYVLRQVSIKVNKIDLWRSFVIAEGTLTYMPQSLDQGMWLKNVPASPIKSQTSSKASDDSVGSRSEIEGWALYEWTGVLRIDQSQVNVGGFKVGEMIVKDFIVLSVVPPNPRLGSLLEVKRVVHIQLTTDNWEGLGQTPIVGPFDNQGEHENSDTNGYLEGKGEGHHVPGQSNGTRGDGVSTGHGVSD